MSASSQVGISQIFQLHFEYCAAAVTAAVDVLLRVGQSTQSNPQLRLMCSTTLSFLCNFDGSKTPEQVSAEARDIANRLEDISGLERMLVALVRVPARRAGRCRAGASRDPAPPPCRTRSRAEA